MDVKFGQGDQFKGTCYFNITSVKLLTKKHDKSQHLFYSRTLYEPSMNQNLMAGQLL